jgi:hypothetical protein
VQAKPDRGDRFHLVDVCDDSEWSRDQVTGAVHSGKGVIERDDEQEFPDPRMVLVLY